MSEKVIVLAYAHQDVVNVLRAELADAEYALLHVTNPQEAIRCLKHLKANISLAIVDLDLVVTSGFDVIRRLARCRHEKRPTIIATSAVDAPLLRHVVKHLLAIRSQNKTSSATA